MWLRQRRPPGSVRDTRNALRKLFYDAELLSFLIKMKALSLLPSIPESTLERLAMLCPFMILFFSPSRRRIKKAAGGRMVYLMRWLEIITF